jgi:hypothetical protein
MNDPSNEIRGRMAAIIAGLGTISHSTGTLDPDTVMSALVLVDHEVIAITNAVARLPKGRQP